MVTNTIVTKVNLRKYKVEFIERVHEARKQDQDWQTRKGELNEVKQHGLQILKHWDIIDGLIYFKNRRYIPVRHTKHPRRNHYSDEALLAIHTVVAHYHTKEGVLAPAM